MNEIKVIEGGVTAAKGFKAAGVYAGIGKNAEKGDLALVYSEVPGNAAAVYTKNKVKAAHIAVTKDHLQDGVHRRLSATAETPTPAHRTAWKSRRRKPSWWRKLWASKQRMFCRQPQG